MRCGGSWEYSKTLRLTTCMEANLLLCAELYIYIYIYDVHAKMDVSIYTSVYRNRFNYGYLYTDSQTRTIEAFPFFPFIYIYFHAVICQGFYVLVRSFSLCGVRFLYLSLVFIE